MLWVSRMLIGALGARGAPYDERLASYKESV